MKLRTSYGVTHIYSQKPPGATERMLVLPGFGESIFHVKPVVNALADTGYEAFTFSPPRRKLKQDGKRTDPISRQGNATLEVLRATLANDEKVHVVAHSLGAAGALRAARLQPERFATLILMQPAGIVTEHQSVYELAKRAAKKVSSNQKVARLSGDHSPGRVAATRFVSGAVIAKRLSLAWREAAAAGNYDIIEDLQKVAELGIPIYLVVSKGDEMFDYVKVERNRSVIESIVKSYMLLDDATANHDTFWIHPKNTATVVDTLLRA